MRRSLASALAIAFLTIGPSTRAQKPKDEPRRPKMPAGVDTNSAQVYYDYGLAKLNRDPEEAANSFYCAARINPLLADAYYGRRCALLLSDKWRFQKYEDDDRRTLQSDEVKRIDSLYYYSLTLNPFLYRKLELVMFRSYIGNWAEDYARRNNVSQNEVQYEIERYINQNASSGTRAWQAYGEGRFADALRLYADAIKNAKHKAEYRADRGRIFFQLNQGDSALAELSQAVDEMRKADKKDLVYVYESKALIEHSIGLVYQRLGNNAAAKEAFGRALQEDLSYFPAHVQLAYMALDAKDTTTALTEMDLAVQIRGDDPGLRYIYGFSLATSGKYKDAEEQLRKAIEIDPVFPTPYAQLGEVLDKQGRGADALAQYRTFLALASQSDLRRKNAEERVRELASKSDQ